MIHFVNVRSFEIQINLIKLKFLFLNIIHNKIENIKITIH